MHDDVPLSTLPRRWWHPSPEYRRISSRFDRIDALLSLALVAVSFWLLWMSGDRARRGEHLELWTELGVGILEAALWAAVIIGIALVRRQGIRSVGFSRTHLGRSMVVGLVLAAAIAGVTAVVGAANGTPPNWRPMLFTYGIPYYLIVIGFAEEALWRGFVTPRLQAQFERRWIGVVLAGLLFALMHAPFTMAHEGIGLGTFVLQHWDRLLFPFAWHFVLWFLYARFNSLAAPTLVHFAMNWSGEMIS